MWTYIWIIYIICTNIYVVFTYFKVCSIYIYILTFDVYSFIEVTWFASSCFFVVSDLFENWCLFGDSSQQPYGLFADFPAMLVLTAENWICLTGAEMRTENENNRLTSDEKPAWTQILKDWSMTKISPFPWTPKTHGKMKVTWTPQYMGEITPRNEGNVGSHGLLNYTKRKIIWKRYSRNHLGGFLG